MKILQKKDGGRILRISKADMHRLSKKAGWEDLFPDDEDDDESYVDYDMGDVDVEDIMNEMDDEEMAKSLFDVQNEVGNGDYAAQCEEAMSILSPVLEDLARGQWRDEQSVVNDLVDAVAPLMGEDVEFSDPLGVVREFLQKPDRVEDEELKRGIRMIMEKAGIPEQEIEEEPAPEPRRASSEAPLGFFQSSDLWYKILKDK